MISNILQNPPTTSIQNKKHMEFTIHKPFENTD